MDRRFWENYIEPKQSNKVVISEFAADFLKLIATGVIVAGLCVIAFSFMASW